MPHRLLTIAALLLTASMAVPRVAASQPSVPSTNASSENLTARRTGRFFAYATLALAAAGGFQAATLGFQAEQRTAPGLDSELRQYSIDAGVITLGIAATSVALFAFFPPAEPDPGQGTRIVPWGLYLATALALVPGVAVLVWGETARGPLSEPAQHPDQGTTVQLVSRLRYGDAIAGGCFALAASLGVWSVLATLHAFDRRDTRTSVALALVPGGAVLSAGGRL
jgi:hypothetical protein